MKQTAKPEELNKLIDALPVCTDGKAAVEALIKGLGYDLKVIEDVACAKHGDILRNKGYGTLYIVAATAPDISHVINLADGCYYGPIKSQNNKIKLGDISRFEEMFAWEIVPRSEVFK